MRQPMSHQEAGEHRSAEEIREQYYQMAVPSGMAPKYRADYAATMARFAASAGSSSLHGGDRESAKRMYREAMSDLMKAIEFLEQEDE